MVPESYYVTEPGDPAEAAVAPPQSMGQRRVLVRHVVVLQVKLFISGWLHFLLGPTTLVAALLDLIWKSDRRGSRFYRVLAWGHRAEEALGLFAALPADSEVIRREPAVGPMGNGKE